MTTNCAYTPKIFKKKVSERALSIYENDELSDKEIRNELYNAFKDISGQLGLTGASKIEEAFNIIKSSVMSLFDKEQQLDDNDIMAALSEWKHDKEPEDNTADHLVKDNEKLERINEDPFETYYQFAINAKIRAKQQANKIGVRSILYNENGVINSVTELNESIRDRQEELLKTVIDYLRTRIPQENQLNHPEIFSKGKMYDGEKYTGIIEHIQELYGSILGSENFDPRILNKYYNEGDYSILDAYSSWIILNNFDTIIQSIFGKAISVNPDMAKFTVRNKYRVAGGSNVYNTWRVSEDIDMTKEVNNITQAIITSIPFIPKGSATPSQSNIKFNEFLYIISKIKGLTQTADKDWTIKINGFDNDFRDKYNGKSFLNLINSIRTNPQEILPDIFRLLNNDNVINSLIGAGVIESNTFLNVDLNLINSLYEGLFNLQNPNSLFSIQDKTGFNKINYFAFINQTIDSAFKSTYLQYFRNPQGEIFIRNMYDQSISNIEYTIRDTINSINSKMMQQEYDLNKYDFKTENRKFVEGQSYNVYYGGNNYILTVSNGQIIGTYDNNVPIASKDLLDKLIETFTETPDNISFTIKDYHKGPLKVIVSLNKNSVTYEINGTQFDSFSSDKDYDSLSDIIQETLRQNLNIDNAYFDAYKNKFKYIAKPAMATNLMSVVSRVLANKYLSNTLLNELTPTQINQKLNQIFGKGKSDIKPVINKQLGEINLLTDSNTRVLLDLAEAKAQATGRLTSSQVIDSNGNAVASNSLSRLLSAYGYQITEQVQMDGSAAQEFSLWNTGVFKGISQMKEIQDNSEDSSKSSTEFSNAEMEYATVFVDFIQSLLTDPVNGKSTLQKGLAAFIPSENSDKTYIGRMLIDLAKLKVGEESIYDILRKDPRRIHEIVPIFAKELGDFYDKALTNINDTWARVNDIVNKDLIPEGYAPTNLKNVSGKVNIRNADLLNSILVSKDGNSLFQMSLGARIFVLANVNGKIIPFYKSSKGTDGKKKGEWYPFFGVNGEGNWLVKGSVESDGKMSYSPEIDRITKILNDNLDIPFLNVYGEFLDKSDSIENYESYGLKKYFFRDMFNYDPQKGLGPGPYTIPNHPRKNNVVGRMHPNKSAEAIYVESITGIDASNVVDHPISAEDKLSGWAYSYDHILEQISQIGKGISYGNWGVVALQALKEGKSTLQYINDKVTEYNNQNPNNPIVLIDQVHYVANRNGELMVNESLLENTRRFKDPVNLRNFLMEQNIEVVKQLLKDRLRVPITPEIQSKIAEWRITNWREASKWIDERTGEMIFAKVYDYDLSSGEDVLVGNIRKHNDLSLLERINPSVSSVEINPILESYNILNYFLTQEFMGSTVGMFYAHPNKKAQNIQQLLKEGRINEEQAHQMILEDEKARKLAQDKRNVSFTASMHSFLKGLIQGIPDEINIAIMDDPHDSFSTVSGDTFDIKPFDGCTFENPWFGEMENASLGGAKVGVNKKTFTHYYDARTGTGGIIKTANFSITNDRVRGSKFYQRMIRNMTDRTWKNQDGTDFIIPQNVSANPNNLIDYNGNPIEFTNPNDMDGQLYFKQNGKYYRIVSIEYLGNNQFRRYLQQVDAQGRTNDEKGNPTEVIPENIQIVNSNYKLWNLFGGAYSMEISEGTNKLQYTENSIKIVSNIINSIGTDPNDKTGQKLPSGIIRTQADVYQPLKHSDIHLMPTVGAVKQGAGNINGAEKYNVSDPNQINFMRIKMNQAGIQLDKEHHADNEDLSIMTQVISACAARGYTQEQQQQMLNALASLARAGINEYLEAFNEFFKDPNGYIYQKNSDGSVKLDANKEPIPIKDKDGNPISTSNNYQQVILDTLVDALVHSTNSAATLQMVTQELINRAKEGKDISFKDANIPYSDPAVFRKLHSTIAVALTRGAIKIKVQGILSVLCPSFGVVKLYNGKTLNSFDSDKQIQAEQEKFDALEYNELIDDIGRLRLGRTYKLLKNDGSLELRNIVTQGDYYALKQQIANGEYYSVKEQFAPMEELGFEGGRELGSYNATFQALKGTSKPMISTDDLRQRIYSVRSWQGRIEKAEELGLRIDKDTEPRNIYEYVCQNFPILSRSSVMQETGLKPADLTKFSTILRTNGITIKEAAELLYGELPEQLQNQTSDNEIRDIIINLLKESQGPTDITRAIYKDRIEEALQDYNYEYQEYQEYLNRVPLTYNINDLASVYRLWQLKEIKASNEEIDQALQNVQSDLMKLHNKKGSIILMNGTQVQIDPKSVDIEPYEIVMPKIFASVFGLEVGDDLNVIKQDKEFFVKKLIESIRPKVSNQFYSIGLMNIGNRSSMYILDRNQRIPNDTDNFIQKDISQISEKGKLWRVNRKGDKMYQMQKGDTVYEYRHPDGTSYEVVVSNNPEFYIRTGSYVTLNCSSSYDTNTFYNILRRNTKYRAVRDYKDVIDTEMNTYGSSLETAIENIKRVSISDINDSPIGQLLLSRGHEIHTSFLQSLKVVAARVPAQCMQSFMPMKVVAFEAPDINTAYVSTAQFLFQGSDLDIDAVSLASFTLDKSGRYVMHSPFANIDTIENLEASEKIPFPTGKQMGFGEGYDFDYGHMMPYNDITDPNLPFSRRNGKLTLNTPQAINRFARFIDMCNKLGYVPKANHPIYEDVAKRLLDIVNEHNAYINDDRAEDFSKNYVVSSMYKIGLSPANMIESQQAMDSITEPLKDVASKTIKAKEKSLENPANFTTNIHGIAQNMAGKKGVGICAVGLKSFFALTARYNEVLRTGTSKEQERLKSDVIIAGKKYQMLANAYGTNISNQAIAQVVSELNNQDQALVLSGLLSLATDNAKELALDKLNAANMLGMYIYGITIGIDFKTLSDIICSETGLIINEMMQGNSFLKQKGMNVQNIFDYLELAPNLTPSIKLSRSANEIFFKLSQQELFNLTHSELSIEQQFNALNKIKNEIDKNVLHDTDSEKQEYYELHRLVEQAENYIERYNTVKQEQNIYFDFKKLNEGAEELRRLGQLLHINQGLENSYSKSINYIDTVTSVIADRQYSIQRERRRQEFKKDLAENTVGKYSPIETDVWKFDFHQFIIDEDYREAWIDIYEGVCDKDRFVSSQTYRNQFIQIFPRIRDLSNVDTAYQSVMTNLKPSKVFFNILDVLQIPHFAAYLQSADMLHQAMMKTSVKYRSVHTLGKRAINILGAYSTDDKEAIYKRTEQMIDRIMRDRYYLSKGISFKLPSKSGYFVKENGQLKRKTVSSSTAPIELGTDEGNASFKLFMETVVIPNLIKGKYGDGNNVNPALSKNEFIKSLTPTLYKHNARYNVTINYAPGINMSPRSDVEKALFEKIKYDFNAFRSGSLSKVKYKIGDKYYSIPELFYYYNQIAFGGRPGENTLTSIFQDILDYKPIKEYRDYESTLDMNGVIEVDDSLLVRETALRRNPWQSNMSYIYYEDSENGLLSFWQKVGNVRGAEDVQIRIVNGYSPVGMNLSEESKNFFNPSVDRTVKTILLKSKEKVDVEINKGRITKITREDKSELKIPNFAKPFFDNPIINVLIQPDGSKQLVYDMKEIGNGIEDLIKCYQ